MWSYIEYLKDPHLVLHIQKFFGVSFKEDKKLINLKKNDKLLFEETELLSDDSESHKFLDNHDYDKSNSEELSSDSESEKKNYKINSLFWYYVFVLGTELGDEIFYATFIPFWFWNIDGAVGRRIVMVWTIVMYIGQGLKDIICWPRPSSPPVFRLQKKWALEYGMPSTHAMVGVSIPFSVLLYTMQRYEYPFLIGLCVAVLWCSVVSISRLYLGMHTVADVMAGIILALVLLVPLVPLVDQMDMFLLTSRWSPVILLTLSICVIMFHPKDKIWTPTRGDTAMIVSVCVGIHIGAWTNFQLGQMSVSPSSPPYTVIWPTYETLGLVFLRCALGFSCIVATRAMCKSAGYATLSALGVSTEPTETPSSLKNTIDLIFKYITYSLIGFNTLHLLPSTFKMLSIDRPTFYTEI
ncbi:sphingosine-1-phosphate phosphatase 2 [Halyomorpha halys]|uniref:sphingosine-1-phosphate phosphatase 2 n=1 Tax=Halyomorpha halys TaxID=286706 RepID=UPI0006D5022F|nr:sphingosine-1-phosphate phosphatase 2 [Halyomorpha halys]